MTPTARRAKDVFLEAVDLGSPDQRAAFLGRACAGDAELRRRVEALLAAHERPESLLDRAAATLGPGETRPNTVVGPPGPVEGPGAALGPYTLLERIGEGGMGVVYRAQQAEPVRREVALKVIKPGMDTEQVLDRFAAERQALALMDHPNIARVLDAGATDAGRPYFIMELVRGVPITRYCDENRLVPRQRLELFAAVCAAIQHAHQKGIIHRDIKPSNVLVTEVDGRPVPKVIDFGVAKAMDQQRAGRTLLTQHGAIVGTPEYMSPEQAGAAPDIDTRTDVYSLGVLLYELLTGTTPLDRESLRRAALGEVLRRVREAEPPSPSTRLGNSGDRLSSVAAVRGTEPSRLTRQVQGDLDWVVMKALEKDRARRYETANGLARDIRRHLDGDPVEAGPPSRVYRLRKFARKHWAGLAAVGVAILGLAVAVSALAVSMVVVSRGRAEALRELARVRSERRELAHVYFRENAMFGLALAQISSKAFELGTWKRREFELIDQAVEFQDLIALQLRSDPEARFEAAFCYYKSGDNEAELSDRDPSSEGRQRRYEHAVGSHRQASELLSQLHAESPERKDYREALQSSLSHLGTILVTHDRDAEAEAILRRALALDDPPAAEFAPPGWKEWPAGRMFTGRGFYILSRILRKSRPAESEAILRRGVARMEGWLGESSGDPGDRMPLGDLVDLTGMSSQGDGGNRMVRRVLQWARVDLMALLRERGKRGEADAILHELAGQDLEEPRVAGAVAWYLATDPDPEVRRPVRAVELARAAVERAPDVAAGWTTLGVALYRTGRWDEAIVALAKSAKLTRDDSPQNWLFLATSNPSLTSLPGPTGGDSPHNALFLAMAHWQKGDRAEARSWYDRAVARLDREGPGDEELTRLRAEADALIRPGRTDDAMPGGPDAFAH